MVNSSENTSHIVYDWNRICLCRVGKYNTVARKTELLRCADLIDGKLVPFTHNPKFPRRFNNRDIFFTNARNNEDSGTWGYWRLSTTQNKNSKSDSDFNSSLADNSHNPIQVIYSRGPLPPLHELQESSQVRSAFLSSRYPTPILFAYRESSEQCLGYLIDPSVFKVADNTSEDKLLTALRVPVYDIDVRCFLPLDNVIFWRFETMEPTAKLVRYACTQDAPTVLALLIRQHFGSWRRFKEAGLEKRDWQAFCKLQEFLTEFPAAELSKFGFTEEEASSAAALLLSRAEAIVKSDDITSEVVSAFIESHSEYTDGIRQQLEDQWRKNHEEREAAAQAELRKLEESAKDLRTAVEKLKVEENQQRQKVDELKDSASFYEELEKEVSAKIETRLQTAQLSVADLLAELPFRLPTTVPLAASPTSPSGLTFPASTPDAEILNSPEDLCETLAGNFDLLGFNATDAIVCARLFIALTAANIPLLLAGPNANDIANAISQAVTGCEPLIVDLDNISVETVLTSIAAAAPKNKPFVLFRGVIGGSRLTTLLSDARLKGCRPIIAVGFAEDLELFSSSLFNYVFPLCTDLLITQSPINESPTASLASEDLWTVINNTDPKRRMMNLPQELHIPRYARNRIHAALSRLIPIVCHSDDEIQQMKSNVTALMIPPAYLLADDRARVSDFATEYNKTLASSELQDFLDNCGREA